MIRPGKYILVPEKMCGDWFWMIYFKPWLLPPVWYSRHNTYDQAEKRLEELNGGKKD